MKRAVCILPVIALLLVSCAAVQENNPITKWNSFTPQEKSMAMAQQFFTFNATYEALLAKPNPSKDEVALMQLEYEILKGLKTAILAYNDAFASNDPMAMASAEVKFLNLVSDWLTAQLSK